MSSETPDEKPAAKRKPAAKKRQKAAKPVEAGAPTAIAPPVSAPATAAPALAQAQPLAVPPPPPKPAPVPAQADEAKPDMPDFEALSKNLARMVEEGGKVMAAYMKPVTEGRTSPDMAEHVADAVKTFGTVAEHWLADPQRTLQAQTALTSSLIDLWGQTWKRLSGEEAAPVAPPDPSDKRFKDPEWAKNPLYDFLRQAYQITTRWANDMVRDADSVDPFTREKAQFYLRQVAGALSPSNFVATNPELLRETIRQSGDNLVRGMKMLAEDVEAGKGSLKIRQSDSTKFELGRDMANTPGKVVFRNALIELIQYAPATPQVFKRPLLIVPPWINKFYVLDLNAEKSFVRFCVENGLTVFLVSWVNPDERHADKGFDAYMQEGILAALDAIEQATGERDVSAIGYCVGGTMLAVTLAYTAARGDRRISSATFLTTQVDFTDAGELKLFVDAERIRAIEESMQRTGYLEGSKMASAFNMLRPNELIWNYVVENYLKGKDPMPFDLLTWNSDSTRMPAANHSFYLRNCYLDNKLAKGEMIVANVKLDLKKVTIPVYNLAAKEDHIAPARSVFTGAKLFGGPMRYVLAGSGHIAGVVNPARKPKYQFWTGGPTVGSFEEWTAKATEHPGSWWTDWIEWITTQAPEKVDAREPGAGGLPALTDAPGDYVRVKA